MSKETTKVFLDSRNKLVATCILEGLDLRKDKSNTKVNIQNLDESTKSWISAGDTPINITEKVQCLSNVHRIKNSCSVNDIAIVSKCDIESDIVS